MECETLQIKKSLLKKSFFTLAMLEILGIVVNSLNNIIDTIFIGKFLDTDAMAAVGFFVPMLTIISLVWIIIIGVQILCGKYIGSGDEEKVQSLFATAVVFLGTLAIGFSLLCFFRSEMVAEILGAENSTAFLLSEYIDGYSFGIFGSVMYSLMLWFLAFNQDVKLSKITIGLMITTNCLCNTLFLTVFDMGIFGLGLASSISYLLAAAVIFQSFFNPNKPIRLRFRNFNFGQILKCARLGTPALTFNLGVTIKAYILNMTLATLIGVAGVATMSVQGAILGILGAIPIGFSNAYMALGSIYYGAKDRNALLYLSKIAMKFSLIFATVIMALLMLNSSFLPVLFFDEGEEAYYLAERMLLIFPCFLVINAFMAILTKAYQFQEKNEWLINSLPIIENLLMAVLAVIAAPILGTDAVWFSYPAADFVCLSLIFVTVITYIKKDGNKDVSLLKSLADLKNWFQIDKNFGFAESEILERKFTNVNDIIKISKEVIDFCLEKNFDMKRSTFAGLAIEELGTNIVNYGFQKNNCKGYIRVNVDKDIWIRIFDNAEKFNLREHLKSKENLSDTIIEHILTKLDYQHNAGINTVVLNV